MVRVGKFKGLFLLTLTAWWQRMDLLGTKLFNSIGEVFLRLFPPIESDDFIMNILGFFYITILNTFLNLR